MNVTTEEHLNAGVSRLGNGDHRVSQMRCLRHCPKSKLWDRAPHDDSSHFNASLPNIDRLRRFGQQGSCN